MRIGLTKEEVSVLAHIMNHFTDYMAWDNRPDHGLGILKQYRDMTSEQKGKINLLAGRLLRARQRIEHKQNKEIYGRKEI
jgi:hypothetical protein